MKTFTILTSAFVIGGLIFSPVSVSAEEASTTASTESSGAITTSTDTSGSTNTSTSATGATSVSSETATASTGSTTSSETSTVSSGSTTSAETNSASSVSTGGSEVQNTSSVTPQEVSNVVQEIQAKIKSVRNRSYRSRRECAHEETKEKRSECFIKKKEALKKELADLKVEKEAAVEVKTEVTAAEKEKTKDEHRLKNLQKRSDRMRERWGKTINFLERQIQRFEARVLQWKKMLADAQLKLSLLTSASVNTAATSENTVTASQQ